MSRSSSSSGRNWRNALGVAAVTSAALLFGAGCANDQPSQSYWESGGTGSRTTGRSVASNSAGSGAAMPASANGPAEQQAAAGNALAFPTGNRATSDLLLEQIGPREVRVGQPYTYQVRVTNLTNQPLTGVVLHERLPENFRLAENDAVRPPDAADQSGKGQATINVGDLGPKQSKTVELTGTPSQPGTLDTCLSARYNPPVLCSHVAVVSPAVRVTGEGPSQADVCQDLVYRYTVANTGTGTAHNVVLHADLPEGVQTADGQQRTMTVNVGDLAQGQSKDVNARLRATQPGRITTQATVTSDAGEARTDQITTQVLAPRLALTITGPTEDYLGQPLSYQVVVKNSGDAPAAQTRLRLGATPGMVQFVNAEGAQGAQLASEQQGGGQDLGTIAPGETKTIAVTFDTKQGGPVAVDATAQANCAQAVTVSANTVIRTLTASALVVTHDPDPVPVGRNVTYHVTVQNKGTAPDHNVQVTAKLPDSEEYVSANGQTTATNDGRTITFGPIDTLQPKQTVTWEVVARAAQPADDAQFKASMTSEATRIPAIKIEPTKLFGAQGNLQTHSSEANQPVQGNPATPTDETQQGHQKSQADQQQAQPNLNK